jgi:SOS-response transcriptional repressor LexA
MDARKRHRLSHAQVQMARELGMNPKKLGGMDNHRQEPWKAPLPDFIEHLYREQFGRDMPLDARPLEERAREAAAKKAARKAEKRARREAE